MSIARLKGVAGDTSTPDSARRMSFGELAALEGVLAQLEPALSIEIGAERLAQIAARSGEVHSFGLVAPELPAILDEKVTLHEGDVHELLTEELKRFADAERTVDFVLVDGSESSERVRQDIEDLLNSPALGSATILIHNTTNETVRAGLDAVHYAAWPKVALVDLDAVPGYLFREGDFRHELWGGLGLIVVDSTRLAYTAGPLIRDQHYPAASLFVEARDRVLERESPDASDKSDGHQESDVSQEDRLLEHIGELEGEILRITSVSVHHEKLWHEMMASVSWRITFPLRWLMSLARRLTGK
jgi:Methyltransferase domain